MTRSRPALSVVIPTLGRPILLRTLRSLLAMDPAADFEVLVVGTIGNEKVRAALDELLTAHPDRLRHLPMPWAPGDSSRKKNAGAEQALAEIIAFLDDDVVVTRAWLKVMLEAFENPEVALVSGPSLIPDDINRMGRLAGLALASPAAGYVAARYRRGRSGPRAIAWSRIIGCNMAFRRSALEGVGRFDTGFWPGEEMLAAFLIQSAGFRILFEPAAGLYHYPRTSLGAFWRQIRGYGATRIRLLRAGVEVEWMTLAPALMLLGLGAALAAWPWFPGAGLLVAAGLGLYAVPVLALSFAAAIRSRRPADVLLCLMIPLMHLSYGLAQWEEALRPGRDLGRMYRGNSAPKR